MVCLTVWQAVIFGATFLISLGVGSFLGGVIDETRRQRREDRREYRLFRAMQEGDEKAGEEWYEMVKERRRP